MSEEGGRAAAATLLRSCFRLGKHASDMHLMFQVMSHKQTGIDRAYGNPNRYISEGSQRVPEAFKRHRPASGHMSCILHEYSAIIHDILRAPLDFEAVVRVRAP